MGSRIAGFCFDSRLIADLGVGTVSFSLADYTMDTEARKTFVWASKGQIDPPWLNTCRSTKICSSVSATTVLDGQQTSVREIAHLKIIWAIELTCI